MTIEALPLPYLPLADDCITLLLLACFFLSTYVLSRSSKLLFQLGKDYLLHRERISLFADSNGSDMRCLLLLLIQLSILSGIFTFCLFITYQPQLLEQHHSITLIGIYIGITWAYLFVKWILYKLLGWIFLDDSKISTWIESYSTVLYYLSFLLMPAVLSIIYFRWPLDISVTIAIIILLIAKLLMLYKWIKLFSVNFYGYLLLFLYFCALEIVPGFVLYKGVIELNDFLIIKI